MKTFPSFMTHYEIKCDRDTTLSHVLVNYCFY